MSSRSPRCRPAGVRRAFDDLSVVGYDNDVILPVPLTTVEHPLDDISHEVKRIMPPGWAAMTSGGRE